MNHDNHTRSRIRVLALPALAVTLALGVLWPRATPAYVILGGPLALDLRAVRVFNNFTDPEANANTEEHPSFPGFTGAELAIWKAAVEWGSTLHGDGQGDPTQPGDLGSGGANFDFAWQGRTDTIGGPDDNVVSQIGGSGLGVLAFTELPADDGWRIRFRNAPWTWHDDPAASYVQTSTAADIQAIATHEFGHALGLDHSNDPTATMSGQIPFPNAPLRSIEADDIAGLQFLYGTRDPSKPTVRSYHHLGRGLIEILGQNFGATGNEVWFTPLGTTAVGVPVAVRGVPSTNGRRLVIRVPADAGPGDLLVRRPGNSFADLSNAFPFSLDSDPCFAPLAYGVGKTTSIGSPATLDAAGSTNFDDQSLTFTIFGLPGQTHGLLLLGTSSADIPFFGGSLLVAPPIQRGPRFQTDFFGFALVPFVFGPELIDQDRFVQAWFVDAADPFGVGTSNGVRVSFCP